MAILASFLILFAFRSQNQQLSAAFSFTRQGTRTPIACFAAKGFGGGGSSAGFSKKKKKSKKSKADEVALSAEAKELLKKHDNNVDFASSDYFENRMESIRSNEELSVEQLHQERVAAAWDTVALFLPQDYARSKGKVDPYVKRRIRHIVRACGFSSAGDDEPSSSQRRRSILDVGCGDGALFPYLPESAVNEKSLHYLGLDVSKEMVELGRKRNPGGTFLVGSFPQDVPSTDDNGDEVLFDCILFNGSLQFFRDQREVLQQAVKRLMPGGRIVLTHVNGGKFVQTECRTNPTVAVSAMPTREFLDSVATELGCTVIDQRLLLEKATAVDPSDLNADSFYLSVLENQIN